MSGQPASMLDIALAVGAATLPRAYRRPLAAALHAALPWLAATPGAGVHRLNLATGTQMLLSRHTRLTLRVPRARADEVAALAGRRLVHEDLALTLGAAQPRELLPHGTLYAHLVAFGTGRPPRDESPDAAGDEAAFVAAVERELATLGVACRAICGRRHVVEDGAIEGHGLMLDRLAPEAARRVLEQGLGAHRDLGCGLFVPHKSAAAVGAAD